MSKPTARTRCAPMRCLSGDFEKPAPWSEDSVKGCKRFLDRVCAMMDHLVPGEEISKDMEVSVHRTIKKVSEDIESMKFNTAIAAMMTLLNEFSAKGSINCAEASVFARLLSPFAPHVAEEMWQEIGKEPFVSIAPWPEYDESKLQSDVIELPVQIQGKTRGKVTVPTNAQEAEVVQAVKDTMESKLEGKTIVKVIYVPGKIVNVVVK